MPGKGSDHFRALSDDVQAFRNYIRAERGMAANTLLAYGRDLDRFAGWVAGGGLTDYLAPSLRDFIHYLEFLRAERLAPPSANHPQSAASPADRFIATIRNDSDSTITMNRMATRRSTTRWLRGRASVRTSRTS